MRLLYDLPNAEAKARREHTMDDLELAPPHLDPETLKNRGSILNIVKSAHKWGGNGTEPDFDKIKRVLTTKHPEVIAKAFGGDPNRAAAWIKDQWYSIFRPGVQWRGKKDPTPGFALPYQLVEASQIEEAELFLADDTAETTTSDNLVWLPISKTGRWAKSPLPGDKPLVLTKQFFEQVKQSFDQGAWEHVTVPLSHADRVDENTGFVKALDIRPDPARPGEWKLWGGIDFRLPEIRDKVLAGAIAGRSIGVATQGITRTLDGVHFPNVLKHVALTNQPWISGLDDGEQLAASYDVLDEVDFSPLLGLADVPGDSYDNIGSGAATKTIRRDANKGSGGTSAGTMPADAHYRVATGGDRCSACTHFGNNFCDLWNAPASADHVSDGFEQVADATDANASLGDEDPADVLALGWLGDTSQDSLDDGDFALVYGSGDSKVRKLPYKIHGKVSAAGVRAALARLHSVKGAPSDALAAARSRLAAAAKQAGVDTSINAGGPVVARILGLAADNETEGSTADRADDIKEAMALARKKYPKGIPPAVRAAILKDPDGWLKANGGDTDDTNMSRGGDNMGEEVLELTREEFDAQVADAVALALSQREQEQAAEMDAIRTQNRELLVERKTEAAQKAGHAPAVIKAAREVWLADTRETEILTLSREEDGQEAEVALSATDIVDGLLAAIPATSLALADPAPGLAGATTRPDSGGSAKEKADALWNRLHGKDEDE